MQEKLREPFPAAIVAFAVTIAFLVIRSKLKNEPPQPNHVFVKPALFVAIVVYGIVYVGQTQSEPLAH